MVMSKDSHLIIHMHLVQSNNCYSIKLLRVSLIVVSMGIMVLYLHMDRLVSKHVIYMTMLVTAIFIIIMIILHQKSQQLIVLSTTNHFLLLHVFTSLLSSIVNV